MGVGCGHGVLRLTGMGTEANVLNVLQALAGIRTPPCRAATQPCGASEAAARAGA